MDCDYTAINSLRAEQFWIVGFKMKKRRINFIIALSLLLIFLSNSNVLAMKLLTPKIGWTATEKNLYWTIDAGNTWKNITPPSVSFGEITFVLFLNTTQGWVLSNRNEVKYKEFFLSYTKDGGLTWLSNSINLPEKYIQMDKNNRKKNPFSGDGWIDFIDINNGWIVLEFPVSAKDNSMGIMLRTENGGKTFKIVADHIQLPLTGDFHFVTSKDGWLNGHVDASLYVTHDGGITWKEVTLEISQQPYFTKEESGDYYDLPIFQNSRQGFLPVTYLRDLYVSTLVLFATNNGGSTWKADRIMPDLKNIAYMYPSALADSILISLVPSETEHSLTLIKVLPNGKTITTTANALNIKGNLTKGSLYPSKWWKLSFITPDQGWVSTNTNQLLSTNDGGKNWTVITPQ